MSTIGALLGGGVGFLARWQGLAIDNLLCATVVLADGSIVKATPEGEHSELLFAIKGGGGNFGIVVEATIKAGKIGWDPNPAAVPANPCLLRVSYARSTTDIWMILG